MSAPSPSISLCVIVRDEAEMLPGFLSAVAGAWDEIVAVDTGSVDGTPRLLAEVGARVVDRPWSDDFSAARNAGLEEARGDWILVLDADERPGAGFASELRRLLLQPGLGAATLRVRSRFASGHFRDSTLLRLFRRDPEVRFRHAIHEDAWPAVEAMLRRTGRRLAALEEPVEHLGYVRGRAAARDKLQRDARLLRASLLADPADLYCWFRLLELARFWGDPVLGRDAAAGLIALLEAGADLRGLHFGGEALALAAAASHPGDPRAALDLVVRFQERCDGSPALLLARGELREAAGDAAAAEADYRRCLLASDPTVQRVTIRPMLALARLDLAAGRTAEALVRVDAALDLAPHDAEAQMAGLALRLRQGVAAAREFAERRQPDPAILEEAVLSAGRLRLLAGSVAEAAAVLGGMTDLVPVAGIGLLVCDLVLGRDSHMDLDLDQRLADEALRGWIVALRQAPDGALLRRFALAAPAIYGLFPWLDGELE